MTQNATLTIDGRELPIDGARNLLEIARRGGIDIPTFCYHSELSVYGACRLCLVDVEGRGVVASCSTPPEPGMVVRTRTEEIRQMRKINVELLLANHDQQCTTCPKSAACQLQDLARRLGVTEVRFKSTHAPQPIDRSSPSLVRNPNKCVLCGDCVRACREIQGIGAIDFVHRGSEVTVAPAFGKDLAEVECVHCGQCAAVCPTGALTPASEVEGVWADLDAEGKVVVAQIAPAVRVALGEQFGLPAGEVTTGQIVAALKAMGFDAVYDTCFAADLTVVEEANEFLARKQAGEKLPQFTSCCPGWVKFVEQYYPELLEHLSTCRSPQQMFGALARKRLPELLGCRAEDLVVVSIMPCTAKKFEAGREEFAPQGRRDVDHVLTTQEVGRMIEEAGLSFNRLRPESLDMPMGFKTGAGVLFGGTGGVTEAVLRYAAEKVTGTALQQVDFQAVRGTEGLREAKVAVGGLELKLAVVHGLGNARKLAEAVMDGRAEYDLIEVMACPGGCIGGAGQPTCRDLPEARRLRREGLYSIDKMLQLHKSQENHLVERVYQEYLGEPNSPVAHELLHTHYRSRRRLDGMDVALGEQGQRLAVRVCVGTGCFVKGSQHLLAGLMKHVEDHQLGEKIHVAATFCLERCGRGPNVQVGDEIFEGCTLDSLVEQLDARLQAKT